MTHNVGTLWVVEHSNCTKLYKLSTVFPCTVVLKLLSTPQTFRQLFNYSCLKYRDLLFMIFTLQNSITAVWLKQWLQLALSHIQYRKTFQQCDMCAVLGVEVYRKITVQHQCSTVTLCHITAFFSHTQKHINMSCSQLWSLIVLNLIIRQQEAIFWTENC